MKKYVYSFLMVLISCAVILMGGQEVSAATINVTDDALRETLISAANGTGDILDDTMCQVLPASLDLSDKGIADLTGLDVCVNKATTPVTEISLSNNDLLTNVSVLANINSVTSYNLAGTSIASFTVSNKIISLDLSDTQSLATLNLTQATALENLIVTNSLLTTFDVTAATNLKTLDLSSNGLTDFDQIVGMDNLTKLELLELNNNEITSFTGLGTLIGSAADETKGFTLNIKNNPLGEDDAVDWEALGASAVRNLDITGHAINWTDANQEAFNAAVEGKNVNGQNIPVPEPTPGENIDGVGSDGLTQPVKVQPKKVVYTYAYTEVVNDEVTDEIEAVTETEEKIDLATEDDDDEDEAKEEDNEGLTTVLSVLGIIIVILIILLLAKKIQESRRDIIVVKKIEPEEEKKKIKLGDKSKKDKKNKDKE